MKPGRSRAYRKCQGPPSVDSSGGCGYADARAARSGGWGERKRDALDKLIAAHATALNVVLVTNNEADFSAYPGLRVENWVDRR